MLDASDQQRLHEIETALLSEDPGFVARMRGQADEPVPHRGGGLVVGGLWVIWVATLLGIASVGWPVLVANTVAFLVLVVVTWRLLRRRRRVRAFVVG